MQLTFSISKIFKLLFKRIIVLIPCLFSNTIEAQREIVEELVTNVREGKIYDVNRITNVIKNKTDVYKVISLLKKYHTDSSRSVKLMILSTEYKIAISQNDINVRKEISTSLATALLDNDPFVWQSAARHLQTFRSIEFSDEAKTMIINLINKKKVKSEFIRLAGAAELSSHINRIRQIIVENDSLISATRLAEKLSWTCHLALARLGIKSDLLYCLKQVEAEKDDVIRVTILLKDLAYTKQQEAIQVIQSYLESEERLPGVVSDKIGTRYCVYAINLLAQIIEDFPVRPKSIYYTDQEIQMCRQWVRENRTYRIIK